jgi:hypothetical protein
VFAIARVAIFFKLAHYRKILRVCTGNRKYTKIPYSQPRFGITSAAEALVEALKVAMQQTGVVNMIPITRRLETYHGQAAAHNSNLLPLTPQSRLSGATNETITEQQ